MMTDTVLGNERGSTIVIALMILAMLTIVGISATNTSTVELQIAGNEANYIQNFYSAEAASMEGARQMEDLTNEELRSAGKPWFSSATPPSDSTVFTWLDDTGNSASIESSTLGKFTVFDTGVADGSKGGSLDMSGTNLHECVVLGYYNDAARGRSLVETGYKIRF